MYCLPSEPLLSQAFVYTLYSVLYRVSHVICSPIDTVNTSDTATVVGQVCNTFLILCHDQKYTVHPDESSVVIDSVGRAVPYPVNDHIERVSVFVLTFSTSIAEVPKNST